MNSTSISTPLPQFVAIWVNQRLIRQSRHLGHQEAKLNGQNFAHDQDAQERLARGEKLVRSWKVEKTDGLMPPGIHMRHFTHRETLRQTESGQLQVTDELEFHERRSHATRTYSARALDSHSLSMDLTAWEVRLDGLPGIYGKWPAKGRIEAKVRASLKGVDPMLLHIVRKEGSAHVAPRPWRREECAETPPETP